MMWLSFSLFVLVMMFVDLGLFSRKNESPTTKQAIVWCIFWGSLAFIFGLGLWFYYDKNLAIEFFTGYIVEQSLSVDNLFVFILIFSAFKIPKNLHQKVLIWGILGAILFRVIFILLGTALFAKFHWLFYIFGIFLVYSGYKVATEEKSDFKLEENKLLSWISKLIPMDYEMSSNFWIQKNGKRKYTPIFLAVIAMAITDVIFAVDSIPAIFAITRDPFIVFTSNIFAVLGLRNLYFLIAGMVSKFVYLNKGLGVILSYVGIKMLVAEYYKIPTLISLTVIFLTLALSVYFSIRYDKKMKRQNL